MTMQKLLKTYAETIGIYSFSWCLQSKKLNQECDLVCIFILGHTV